MEKYPPINHFETFLAMPNDFYKIEFIDPLTSQPYEIDIRVFSFSLIRIDRVSNTFSVSPIQLYKDLFPLKCNG